MREPRRWLEKVTSAGSVFLGAWSPEPMGDYCSGTNHVLPTYGYARAYSGLSVLDFVKRITVQELSPAGLRSLGPVAVTLARLEGLDAHAGAVTRRLAALREDASAPVRRSVTVSWVQRARTTRHRGAQALRARLLGAEPRAAACQRAALAPGGR